MHLSWMQTVDLRLYNNDTKLTILFPGFPNIFFKMVNGNAKIVKTPV